MCLTHTNIKGLSQWNWDGDAIVQNPIIPASRTVPHTKISYDIDLRQFLTLSNNAVIHRTLNEIIDELNENDKKKFLSNKPGSYDYRVQIILNYISKNNTYKPGKRKYDTWQFPEETLSLKHGDCEDRAFLLASLIVASGVSNYVVRVALGKLYNRTIDKSQDHVWVMYKNESGLWILIEPLVFDPSIHLNETKFTDENKNDVYEYIPYFLFNSDHVWAVADNSSFRNFNESIENRTFWRSFNPEFATSVHNSIFDEALTGLSSIDINIVKAYSLAVDSIQSYDPRDHFDNGYINESWELLNNRINNKSLTGLAYACHAVADFYAHSSYAHFGKKENEKLVLFNGVIDDSNFEQVPDYGSGTFNVKDKSRFSVNPALCKLSSLDVVQTLNSKKIISGRFAQPSDPSQGFLERVFINIPYSLRSATDFKWRGCLPHHNEIAVDEPLNNGKVPSGHKLYQAQEFEKQFNLRKDAAIRHVQKLYITWKS
jgi:hypothetical protein